MSLESTVAALVALGGQLTALPAQITALATQKIAEINAAYTARIANLTLLLYVDQVNGLDTNAGTSGAPLKSIKAACDKVPFGAYADIFVIGAYNMTEDVVLRSRTIQILGNRTTRPRLTFGRYAFVPEGSDEDAGRGVYGFMLYGRTMLSFSGFTVVVPVLDGAWPGFTRIPRSQPICTPTKGSLGLQVVKFTECNIEIPSGTSDALIDTSTSPLALHMSAIAATIAPLLGRLVPTCTNTAGTNVEALPWLTSNMDKV